jgi:UDP-glucose 4-epimerase
MQALVTGGAGFLGLHVCRRLLEEDYDVTVFDQRPADLTGVRNVIGDLADLDAVESAISGHDVVCHIGAIGDVYLAAAKPGLAAQVNVTGSANVAEAALRNGARVIYASTWEVYGPPHYEPVDEHHPCEPDHPYNITKLAGERMLLAAAALRGLPVLSLRLGTAYGSGLRPNSVFRVFIDRARRGEPITVQGDGSQGRQFTHVEDIANAFARACRSPVTGIALNAVAPEVTSIKALAEAVVARFPTELTFGDPRPGDVPPSYVSGAKIREVLGWVPRVPFAEGLTRLMEEP